LVRWPHLAVRVLVASHVGCLPSPDRFESDQSDHHGAVVPVRRLARATSHHRSPPSTSRRGKAFS